MNKREFTTGTNKIAYYMSKEFAQSIKMRDKGAEVTGLAQAWQKWLKENSLNFDKATIKEYNELREAPMVNDADRYDYNGWIRGGLNKLFVEEGKVVKGDIHLDDISAAYPFELTRLQPTSNKWSHDIPKGDYRALYITKKSFNGSKYLTDDEWEYYGQPNYTEVRYYEASYWLREPALKLWETREAKNPDGTRKYPNYKAFCVAFVGMFAICPTLRDYKGKKYFRAKSELPAVNCFVTGGTRVKLMRRCDEVKKAGGEVLGVITDSVIYKGPQIPANKNKVFGDWLNEYNADLFLPYSINHYALECNGKRIKTTHGGLAGWKATTLYDLLPLDMWYLLLTDKFLPSVYKNCTAEVLDGIDDELLKSHQKNKTMFEKGGTK